MELNCAWPPTAAYLSGPLPPSPTSPRCLPHRPSGGDARQAESPTIPHRHGTSLNTTPSPTARTAAVQQSAL